MAERTVAVACSKCFLSQDTKPLARDFYRCGVDMLAVDEVKCAECNDRFLPIVVEIIPDKTKEALNIDPSLHWRLAPPPRARLHWRTHQCRDAQMGRTCSKGPLACPFWHLPWDRHSVDSDVKTTKKRVTRRKRDPVCRGWRRSGGSECPRGVDECPFEHPPIENDRAAEAEAEAETVESSE